MEQNSSARTTKRCSGGRAMLECLDKQTKLTRNQYRIIGAAVLGDMLEFFDLYLIGFVLAIIIKPWNLTFGVSAVILLSSGVGAMMGAAFWGYIADRIGRKTVFIATVLNFSIATGILAFTPDNGWLFLTFFRFLTGFGVGGLYSVDLPLVQEFVPSNKRGFISGMITSAVPVGSFLAATMGAFLAPYIGWRGLFAVGVLPAALTLVIRAWVPESPRWLASMGRAEEARKSLAWALDVDPKTIPLSTVTFPVQEKPHFSSLFQYPRSLCVSWFGNLGIQVGTLSPKRLPHTPLSCSCFVLLPDSSDGYSFPTCRMQLAAASPEHWSGLARLSRWGARAFFMPNLSAASPYSG
jgi:putative MFS transporter